MMLSQVIMAMMIHVAASQSLPSPTYSGGMIFPGLSTSSQSGDQWVAESSPKVVTALPTTDQARRTSYRSADTGQGGYSSYPDIYQSLEYLPINSSVGIGSYDSLSELADLSPVVSASSPRGSSLNYAPAVKDTRNHTSRFFSVNTASQTLDLGLSFTVPFLSIPMSSLLSMGQDMSDSTSSALNSLMAVNWPSVLVIGAVVLAAALFLPQIVSAVSGLIGTGSTSTTGGAYTTTSYGRNVERGDSLLAVSPFTSILEQLDDALAQYDLDATSCMQRATCSYVADSEISVKKGDASSYQMIVSGLARSPWLEPLVGQTSVAQALEMGRSGGNCQLQYPKCPFSLPGLFKFLATYATAFAN